jgi:PKD repeat protein
MPYRIDSDNDSYPLMVPWAIYFPPVAIFTYAHVPVVNQPILFDASYSLGQGGKITNYEWDFGDGNTTNTAEPIIIHSYSLAGNYTVNLTVMNNNGAMNSTSKVITVLKSAPTDEEEWNRTFGGTDYDIAYSVQQTSDGGYIIAGETESYDTGGSDVWLVKTDSDGNEQWNKTFGGTSDEEARAVQQTEDGGYILAGHTESYGSGDADFWLVKTDSNGNKQWDKTFGGSSNEEAHSVQQTEDGGYILTGYTWSYGSGDADFWLVKTDSEGNKQWDKTFGGTNFESAWSVQQTTGGGYILAGHTESYGAGGADVWLVKTDSDGNEQWNKTFGGTFGDRVYAVQQTTDGGYILARYTELHSAGAGDFLLVKTDSDGNEQWNKTFGGTSNDGATSVQQTTDGGYILAGFTESYGAGGGDVWLVKTDSDGNKQWDKTFGGSGDEVAFSIQQTTDGGYILAGGTDSYGAGNADSWLIKVKGKG